MGKVSTEKLLDSFFGNPEGAKYASKRKLIREEQLYEYEMEIGKELVDMDADEIIGFLSNMKTRRNSAETNTVMNNYSLDQVLVIYRKVFDYYIEEFEVIKNPFRNPKRRGTELYNRLYENKERFSWEMVEDIIRKLHSGDNQARADYIELIMLLYYNGFENATEIVEMQERDVNQSYFKFIVRASKADEIDERPLKVMRENINVYLCKYVNNEYNTHINYSNLYLLGFYDYLVGKFGEDRVNEMLLSNYDSEAVQQLQQTAREYGFKYENVSHLKRRLRMFVKPEEE